MPDVTNDADSKILLQPDLRAKIIELKAMSWELQSNHNQTLKQFLSDPMRALQFHTQIDQNIEDRLQGYKFTIMRNETVHFVGPIAIKQPPTAEVNSDLRASMEVLIGLETSCARINLNNAKVTGLLRKNAFLSKDQFKEGDDLLKQLRADAKDLTITDKDFLFRLDSIEFNLLHQYPATMRDQDQQKRYEELQKTHKPAQRPIDPEKVVGIDEKSSQEIAAVVEKLGGVSLVDISAALPLTATDGKTEPKEVG